MTFLVVVSTEASEVASSGSFGLSVNDCGIFFTRRV